MMKHGTSATHEVAASLEVAPVCVSPTTTTEGSSSTNRSTGFVGETHNGSRCETGVANRQLIAQLQRQIRQVERGSPDAHELDSESTSISSGIAAMNQLLPDQGYRRGSLIEWLVPGGGGTGMGYGAELLSLQLAVRSMSEGGRLVVVDPGNEFYVPAARALGIELDRLVILKGQKIEDLYWSMDQALRCVGVAAVWAMATPALPRFLVDMNERWHRRFQLSAEATGTLGLFIRPDRVARQPGWSDVQWRILPQPPLAPSAEFSAQVPFALPADYWCRPISLQLLRCRGGRAGSFVHLNFDTRTGELTSDAGRRLEFARSRVPGSSHDSSPRRTG